MQNLMQDIQSACGTGPHTDWQPHGNPNRGIAMRKSNISLALVLALATTLTAFLVGFGAMPARAAADAVKPEAKNAKKDEIRLQDNAPDRHIVVQGDTLWGIAAKFLKDPWRWPDLWRMNQEQIKSPHRIYPGNIIVLDRTKEQPQLKLATPVIEKKLDPRVRVEKGGADIPSIASALIEPFLSQPLVIEEDGMDAAPRIVAAQEDRVYVGSGNIAYVTGIDKSSQKLWQIYRPGKPLVDPETRRVLGYEAFYLGVARVSKEGNPATIEIITAKQEIGRGDRLLPAARALPLNYVPHAPDKMVQGRVVSSYGGINETGRNSIITINKGSRDGMEIGHVLALYRFGKSFTDVTPASAGGDKVTRKLPDERYGLIFVFRVFEQVSYALVLNVSRPVNVNDVVQTP